MQLNTIANTASSLSATNTNMLEEVKRRVQTKTITWTTTLIMCFVRFPLLLTGFLATFLLIRMTGHTNALLTAQGITRFDIPVIVDVVCLLLLFWFTRKEGIRLQDLLCLTRKHLLRDIIMSISLFMVAYSAVFALTLGAVFLLASQAFLQSVRAIQLLVPSINPLGLSWHIIVSLVLLPITTGITEEMVYRGYVQPRLQALTNRRWLALLLMALGFATQHIAYGIINWQLALIDFLSAFVAGILFGVLYLLTKQRLLPLIFIHWQFDLISIGIVPLFLMAILH